GGDRPGEADCGRRARGVVRPRGRGCARDGRAGPSLAHRRRVGEIRAAPRAEAPVSGGFLVEAAGPIHRWTLDRPERRNALDVAIVDALLGAAERAGADPGCRAVLL